MKLKDKCCVICKAWFPPASGSAKYCSAQCRADPHGISGRMSRAQFEQKRRENQTRFRAENPTYYRDKSRERVAKDPKAYALYARQIGLKSRYGITHVQYDQMVKDQKRRCAICLTDECGQKRKHFCVDHNHKNGKVRGLLCHRCNRAIGLLKDDVKILKRATSYLQGFQ